MNVTVPAPPPPIALTFLPSRQAAQLLASALPPIFAWSASYVLPPPGGVVVGGAVGGGAVVGGGEVVGGVIVVPLNVQLLAVPEQLPATTEVPDARKHLVLVWMSSMVPFGLTDHCWGRPAGTGVQDERAARLVVDALIVVDHEGAVEAQLLVGRRAAPGGYQRTAAHLHALAG